MTTRTPRADLPGRLGSGESGQNLVTHDDWAARVFRSSSPKYVGEAVGIFDRWTRTETYFSKREVPRCECGGGVRFGR